MPHRVRGGLPAARNHGTLRNGALCDFRIPDPSATVSSSPGPGMVFSRSGDGRFPPLVLLGPGKSATCGGTNILSPNSSSAHPASTTQAFPCTFDRPSLLAAARHRSQNPMRDDRFGLPDSAPIVERRPRGIRRMRHTSGVARLRKALKKAKFFRRQQIGLVLARKSTEAILWALPGKPRFPGSVAHRGFHESRQLGGI